jgi:hypothetical protein
MCWGGFSSVCLAGVEESLRCAGRAQESSPLRYNQKVGLIGKDAGAPTDKFSNTAEFSTD